MILYSPIVPEAWEGLRDYQPDFVEIRVGQVTLVVEPLSFGKARIVRLISTEPAYYLNSCYQPGTILEFLPAAK